MSSPALLHRPVYGGPFGRDGRYSLATLPCVLNGLHAVRHLVIEPVTGTVLSVAETKLGALAAARDVLKASAQLARAEALAAAGQARQGSLWPPDAFEQPPVRETRPRPVSKRRRDIHAKCGGRCHYCSTPLELAGSWHVEHALPRALGGLDEIANLFAACAHCNLVKRDQTALEFVARQSTLMEVPMAHRYEVVRYDVSEEPASEGLSHRKGSGFEDPSKALEAAKAIVDADLLRALPSCKSAAELVSHFEAFGEGAIIFGEPRVDFDVYAYVQQRARQLLDDGATARKT